MYYIHHHHLLHHTELLAVFTQSEMISTSIELLYQIEDVGGGYTYTLWNNHNESIFIVREMMMMMLKTSETDFGIKRYIEFRELSLFLNAPTCVCMFCLVFLFSRKTNKKHQIIT
jgi:hypothetical protein